MDEFSFSSFFLSFCLSFLFSFLLLFLSFVWGYVMDDPELVKVAAHLCDCAPAAVLSLRLYPDRLAVVYGYGQKKVFPVADVDWARTELVLMQRAQMIVSPVEDDIAGLQTLFPDKLVKVLLRAGYASPGAVQRASDEELRDVGGVGPATLRDIRELLPARRHEE